MKLLPILCAILFATAASAQQIGAKNVYPPEYKDGLIKTTLEYYWGRAKDKDGNFIQPKDENDRKTVPLSREAAYRVIDNALVAGAAQHCKIDYKPYYRSYMKLERKLHGWSDKESAFIGVLFGAAQGSVANALQAKPCDAEKKKQVAVELRKGQDMIDRMLR